MSKKVIVTILEGIEEVASLLDGLPEIAYDLMHATRDNLGSVLEKNLSHMESSGVFAFVIVLSQESYRAEMQNRTVASMLTANGIKAEPIFLVVDKTLPGRKSTG